MMNRKWPMLVLLASAGAAGIAVACTTTGPDAEPRKNGCISQDCYDATAPTGDGATGPGTEGGGGTDGGPMGFPNPLDGVNPLAATLVKNGFQLADGPVWIADKLLFGDTQSSPTVILQLEPDNSTTTFRSPGNGPSGNAKDNQQRLVTCESRSRVVVRSAATMGAAKTTIASQFGGKPFNSPNDLVTRSDGNIYFTDPDYGADPDAAVPRQPKQSVFRIDAAGAVSRVKEYDTEPNGIGLSPDGNKLYVVDTAANNVMVWDVAADGTPGNETNFATVTGGDGMAVDDAGNVYVAAQDGIFVFDKGGKALGTITVPEVPTNCTFGGADRKTLYITAHNGLYSIKLNVPGLP